MKVPVSWLQEFLDFRLDTDRLVERLTFSGTEVEGVEVIGGAPVGVIVGEVRAVAPHPDADRLTVCQVFDGRETVAVVCGAPNVAAGCKAAFAPVGVTLPGGLTIGKRKVRGVESCGMLCAADELGLADDHAGILLLDDGARAGAPLAEALPPAETVLQVEITWNRPDCLSVLGLAREIAAVCGGHVILPAVDFDAGGDAIEKLASVSIEAPELCARYTARVIDGLTPAPSPAWMQRRLELCGVRPINLAVDVTNYVLLECGQPLHAFDHAKLEGGRIVVRRASAGERLTTLDDETRELTADRLVIADSRKPLALAGVMGGIGSEISASTRRVLLESAGFDPPSIHRTSVALGLSSESSSRFERGVDVALCDWASRRACHLYQTLGGGRVAIGQLDVYPGRTAPREVDCRFDRLNRLLGIVLDPDEVVGILTRLGLEELRRDGAACGMRIPSWREDLRIEADLIEEVARIHGLEQLPEVTPHGRIGLGLDDRPSRATAACRDALCALGLFEAMHYSFLAPESLDLLSDGAVAERVVLPNPVSADHRVMRDSLLPQLVESLGRNMAHQVRQAGLFELGRTYHLIGDRHRERERLSIGLMGAGCNDGRADRKRLAPDEALLALKGLLESLAAALHATGLTFDAGRHAAMEPGYCVAVGLDGAPIGCFGLLRPALAARWRIAEPVALAEIDQRPLVRHVFDTPSVSALPAYPSVNRDVAVIVDDSVRHADIVEQIRRAGPPELTAVRLFDIYSDSGIGERRKSLAYSLVFRSLERTLTDEEANRFQEAIRGALKQELNAEVRDG